MNLKIILAPLQGYTDAVFREIYFNHFTGVDHAMAPFIATMGEEKINLSRLKDVIPENNPNCGLTPQILSNVAEDFIFLSEQLMAMGYDNVNWNMGCPHSKVAKKRRGSGMLNLPEMVDQLLDRVFSRLKCRLSLKVRLGRYTKNEIYELLPVFEKYPLDEIVVHPRTGVQMYTGAVDLDAFMRVADNTSHRLVYNGDINSVRFFNSILELLSGGGKSGISVDYSKRVEKFMMGRGILANPFLPSEIKREFCKEDSGDEKDLKTKEGLLEKIKIFHNELFEAYSNKFYGPLHVTGRMKGFWTYMGPSFPENAKEVKKMLKAKSREHYAAAAENFFSSGPDFRPEV